MNFKWGGKGFIQRREIRSKIKIYVKTFHSKREDHEFSVSISDKIEKLKGLLASRDPEEMSAYHFIKIMYPMGTMRTLNFEETFE